MHYDRRYFSIAFEFMAGKFHFQHPSSKIAVLSPARTHDFSSLATDTECPHTCDFCLRMVFLLVSVSKELANFRTKYALTCE